MDIDALKAIFARAPAGEVAPNGPDPGRAATESSASPPAAVPPPEPDGAAPIPAGLAQAVGAYLDRIGEDDPRTRREALDLAAGRPEIAARYLTGDLAGAGAAPGGAAGPVAAAVEIPDPEALAEAVNDRAAILIHLGGMPEAQARAVADLAGAYYAHHWGCSACRDRTLAGAKRHLPCPAGAALWARYTGAAGRGRRP